MGTRASVRLSREQKRENARYMRGPELSMNEYRLMHVLLKLCYYKYTPSLQETWFNLFNPSILKKTKKLEDIEQYLQNDKKGQILTPFTHAEGWVFVEHIERDTCPYPSPEGHRYEYLPKKKGHHALIERQIFSYSVKKPDSKNRRIYTEPVYRLRRDKKTFLTVRKFIQHVDPQAVYYFDASDYANDVIDRQDPEMTREDVRMLQSSYAALMAYWGLRLKNDEYPVDNKRKEPARIEHYAHLVTALGTLGKDLLACPELAVAVATKEQELKRLINRRKEDRALKKEVTELKQGLEPYRALKRLTEAVQQQGV